ncbi:MAG: transcriptional regulator [Clostridiaceae bacterium]|nr:transcriptional regulator [Clostridiaceae bacterium]
MSSEREKTKNDIEWSKLFSKYKILEHIDCNGFFEITSAQINEFREARLMTKFDHSINLPKLFSDNKLAILPVTRGSYIISRFEAYKRIEQVNGDVIKATFPEYIESIDYENITSEATAINCAFVSRILSDFLDEEKLLPTVSGRMSSESFSFRIRNTLSMPDLKINVSNSQIEIDGGFEGIKQLCLIEAKNFISEDFLIRQLYYPYRLWKSKISKKITSILLVYTNGIFSLYEYEFQEPDNYNSLVLVKQRNYCIDPIDISLDDIVYILKRTSYVDEPSVPFPQANSFKRVINLCELLFQSDMTRDDITTNYAFDQRQTNYYTDAGRYLGLIRKYRDNDQVCFSLTEEGRKIIRSKYKVRQLKFVEAILRHKAFADTLKLYLLYGKMPSKNEVVNIMKNCNLYGIKSQDTFERRSSTITSWINWILSLLY